MKPEGLRGVLGFCLDTIKHCACDRVTVYMTQCIHNQGTVFMIIYIYNWDTVSMIRALYPVEMGFSVFSYINLLTLLLILCCLLFFSVC